ncbi:unnamed protein product, partial [Didymodactylos carnosus]
MKTETQNHSSEQLNGIIHCSNEKSNGIIHPKSLSRFQKIKKMSTEYLVKAQTVPIIDIDERDPLGINKHLQLDWQNVFCEPDKSAHNFSTLWKISYNTYHYTKLCIYRFLVAIIGLPLVFIWALTFAFYTFFMIYLVTPCRRLFQSIIVELGIYVHDLCAAFIAPFFRAIGAQFTDFRIRLANEQVHITKQIQ